MDTTTTATPTTTSEKMKTTPPPPRLTAETTKTPVAAAAPGTTKVDVDSSSHAPDISTSLVLDAPTDFKFNDPSRLDNAPRSEPMHPPLPDAPPPRDLAPDTITPSKKAVPALDEPGLMTTPFELFSKISLNLPIIDLIRLSLSNKVVRSRVATLFDSPPVSEWYMTKQLEDSPMETYTALAMLRSQSSPDARRLYTNLAGGALRGFLALELAAPRKNPLLSAAWNFHTAFCGALERSLTPSTALLFTQLATDLNIYPHLGMMFQFLAARGETNTTLALLASSPAQTVRKYLRASALETAATESRFDYVLPVAVYIQAILPSSSSIGRSRIVGFSPFHRLLDDDDVAFKLATKHCFKRASREEGVDPEVAVSFIKHGLINGPVALDVMEMVANDEDLAPMHAPRYLVSVAPHVREIVATDRYDDTMRRICETAARESRPELTVVLLLAGLIDKKMAADSVAMAILNGNLEYAGAVLAHV